MSNDNDTDCTCQCIAPATREPGSGVLISPPEWEQADDCPAHPALLHCERCGTQAVVVETSEEASGAMEAERQWLVTYLACEHRLETEIRAEVSR